MASLEQSLIAIIIAIGELLSFFVFGEFVIRLCRVKLSSTLHKLVFRYWIGTITYATLWLVLGLLHLLKPITFVVFTAICIGLLGWIVGSNPKAKLKLVTGELWRVLVKYRLITGLVSIYGLLQVVSCFRLLPYGDEIQYLWPSPLHWAASHTWSASPFRHSDGPILWNILHTIPALFESNVAAHLINLSVVPMTCLVAVLIGRKLGLSAGISGSVPLGIPAFMNSASTCSTDVPSSGLTVYVIYLGILGVRQLKVKNLSIPAFLLFASLYSVKLTAITVLLPFSLLALRSELSEKGVLSVATFKSFVVYALKVAYLPVLLSLVGWAMRTFMLTGHFYDNRNVMLATGPDHWLWHTGGEIARIPNMAELLIIPALPFLLPIIGQTEPYGARTGLAALMLIPAVLMGVNQGLKRRGISNIANLAIWIIISGWITYCLVSLLIPKTRYSGYVWPVITLASLAFVNQTSGPSKAKVFNVLAMMLVLVSIYFDQARIQVSLLLKVILQ
jgi:hypothetical protein